MASLELKYHNIFNCKHQPSSDSIVFTCSINGFLAREWIICLWICYGIRQDHVALVLISKYTDVENIFLLWPFLNSRMRPDTMLMAIAIKLDMNVFIYQFANIPAFVISVLNRCIIWIGQVFEYTHSGL